MEESIRTIFNIERFYDIKRKITTSFFVAIAVPDSRRCPYKWVYGRRRAPKIATVINICIVNKSCTVKVCVANRFASTQITSNI